MNMPDLKDKRVWYWTGGIAGIYVVYRYWRASKDAAAAATASDQTAMDTGLAVGGGGAYGTGGSSGTGGTTATGIVTNADWSQAALAALVNVGWDAGTVASSLGRYLDHQALTDAEITIVRAAIALTGLPPQGSYVIIHSPATATTPPAGETPQAGGTTPAGEPTAYYERPVKVDIVGGGSGVTVGVHEQASGARVTAGTVNVQAHTGDGRWVGIVSGSLKSDATYSTTLRGHVKSGQTWQIRAEYKPPVASHWGIGMSPTISVPIT